MDQETAKYVITYFAHLLTGDEKWAIEQKVLDLHKEGYDSYEMRVASRILNEHGDDVFLNKCPKCGKLARTPQARQCRHCGHNWHYLNVAQFQLNNSFQITGRHFFLLGEIISGEVEIGNYIDLAILGLSKKTKIDAIESASKQKDGATWGNIALGTSSMSETEKEHLIRIGSFGTPLDIVKER